MKSDELDPMDEQRTREHPIEEDRMRELLALRAYGELDAEDAAELERLVARSPALRERARAYAAELERGLGRLARGAPARPELPADWRERLRAEISARPRRRPRVAPWLTAAAGLAAGWLLAWTAQRPAAPAHAAPDAEFARFARETPPPLATAGGELARLSGYLR